MSKNMLTILIPVYNCEKYVAQTLDSILEQKTQYKYSVLCYNDGSSDKSLDILKKYQKKYPDIIRVKNQKNKGLADTILSMYKTIDSKYWCVLDADDYWINKEHIQNALDFLEKNTDYTMYTTGLYLKYNNGQIIEQSKVKKSTFSNKNIKKIPLCHTSNTVFRNVWNISDVEEISKMSLANKQSFRGDSFRKFYAINHGKCYLDDNFDSVYRISGEGIWSHLKQRQKILLEIRLHINMMKFFNLKNARFHMEYLHKMVEYFCEYGNDVVSNNDANEFLVYLKDYIDLCKKCNFKKGLKKFNNVSFMMPSRGVGGYQFTFMRFAKYISENLNIDVNYLDYPDGTARKELENTTKINFLKYYDNQKHIKIKKNTNLFVPFTWINQLPKPSKKSNVLFWDAHQKSREWTKFRSKLSNKKIDKIIQKFDLKNGIAYMDGACFDALQSFYKQKLNKLYIPGFVDTKDEQLKFPTNIKNQKEIHLCWLGRLDPDKIFSVLNLLKQFDKYETQKKKYVHIIGNGASVSLIKPENYKTLNIKMLSTMVGKDLEQYLLKNVDLMFCLGTSLLEGASLKIPAFLVLGSEKEYDIDEFIPLFDLKEFVLGVYVWQKRDIYNRLSMSQILDDIYNKNNFAQYSQKSFDFYNENHRLETSVANMLRLLFKSKVQWKSKYTEKKVLKIVKKLRLKNRMKLFVYLTFALLAQIPVIDLLIRSRKRAKLLDKIQRWWR